MKLHQLPDLLLLLTLFLATQQKSVQAGAPGKSWASSWSHWMGTSKDASEDVLASGANDGEFLHPVRQEIVDQIKEKTTKWKPLDPSKNPMRKVPTHLVRSSLGLLGKDEPDNYPKVDYAQLITEPVKLFRKALALSEDAVEEVEAALLDAFSKKSSSSAQQTPRVRTGSQDDETEEQDYGIIRGNLSLPAYYNIREEYPHCQPRVLDQGLCGACWGFAAAGVLGDRMCMQSNGTHNNLTLSPQDMVNCAFESYGCDGGYLIPAVDFLITEGVARDSCFPYLEMKDECSFECKGALGKDEAFEKFYCQAGTVRVSTTVEDMQQDIYENGPIMVGLLAWDDLYSYESGIYEHVVGELVGGHAMRAVGWGHDEDGHLYWICQNQWTSEWGMNGYVHMKAGEVSIDTWALSCQPDVDFKSKQFPNIQ